jgi:predicted RNase H-like nuclease (RuvC/YqgF family)
MNAEKTESSRSKDKTARAAETIACGPKVAQWRLKAEIRTLRREVERLKAENEILREECASYRALGDVKDIDQLNDDLQSTMVDIKMSDPYIYNRLFDLQEDAYNLGARRGIELRAEKEEKNG